MSPSSLCLVCIIYNNTNNIKSQPLAGLTLRPIKRSSMGYVPGLAPCPRPTGPSEPAPAQTKPGKSFSSISYGSPPNHKRCYAYSVPEVPAPVNGNSPLTPPGQTTPLCKGRWHGVSRDGEILTSPKSPALIKIRAAKRHTTMIHSSFFHSSLSNASPQLVEISL